MATKLVCLKCNKDWRGSGSPSTCPDCKKLSAAIAVPKNG